MMNPVSLRPLRPADADVIAGWAADPAFCRHADWPAGLSFTERQRFHQTLIQRPPPELTRLGAIVDGLLVGYVDLHGDELRRRELGFVVGGVDRWGRGLGRFTGAAGLDHGFDQMGLREVWAQAPSAHQRSLRVLQRLRFTETGRGDDCVFLDQPTHYRRFAITAVDWATNRGLVFRDATQPAQPGGHRGT